LPNNSRPLAGSASDKVMKNELPSNTSVKEALLLQLFINQEGDRINFSHSPLIDLIFFLHKINTDKNKILELEGVEVMLPPNPEAR